MPGSSLESVVKPWLWTCLHEGVLAFLRTLLFVKHVNKKYYSLQKISNALDQSQGIDTSLSNEQLATLKDGMDGL